jgi:hypothetical protein
MKKITIYSGEDLKRVVTSIAFARSAIVHVSREVYEITFRLNNLDRVVVQFKDAGEADNYFQDMVKWIQMPLAVGLEDILYCARVDEPSIAEEITTDELASAIATRIMDRALAELPDEKGLAGQVL